MEFSLNYNILHYTAMVRSTGIRQWRYIHARCGDCTTNGGLFFTFRKANLCMRPKDTTFKWGKDIPNYATL
jgi:hypothetical protein